MASIFTKIINREIPAHIIHEDEQTLAFLDIRPVSRGHLLVVPKKEVDHFQDLDTVTYQAVMATVQQMAKLLQEKLQPERVGVVIYGFDVPHAHVHLIPMDGPGQIKIPHSDEAAHEDLADVRKELVD